MPKYRIEIVEEVTRVAVIEVPDGVEIDSRVLDLATDVAIEASVKEREVDVRRVNDAVHADGRFG
ncbi:hypothetical protein [Gordonia hydrophobica]|uniref:Uncharacterized protein n=1 Tax=Gordonia hydrophobica TaxID=40516 RepID=A0ABZ2U2P6_9ACTN|nr:hypothetical protein [Gordonia hydrophobica]MBM7368983.1 hypothetical protein [Gordonia hydrophobica]